MRPYTLQKPLDISKFKEGLRELFRQMSESARQDGPLSPEQDSTRGSHSIALEMT